MKIVGLFLLLASSQAFSQVVPNFNWVYRADTCHAQTVCPDGKVIGCSTVAFNYGRGVPNIRQNNCSMRVIPHEFVRCRGFDDKPVGNGRVLFTRADYIVSCY